MHVGLYIASSAGILYLLLRPPTNKLKWTAVAEEDHDLENGQLYLYVCMYVNVYVCLYVCMYCMYVCMYVCM